LKRFVLRHLVPKCQEVAQADVLQFGIVCISIEQILAHRQRRTTAVDQLGSRAAQMLPTADAERL
jgi:hypothetical protein